MTTETTGYYVLYPRGSGAATGPMPNGYVLVSRWTGVAEARLWMQNGATHIPQGIGAGGRVYLTLFGAKEPPGTDSIRVDFGIPEAALQVAGTPEWRQLPAVPVNTPIYNVSIHAPISVQASSITGRR
jgi:hypothetical protein